MIIKYLKRDVLHFFMTIKRRGISVLRTVVLFFFDHLFYNMEKKTMRVHALQYSSCAKRDFWCFAKVFPFVSGREGQANTIS